MGIKISWQSALEGAAIEGWIQIEILCKREWQLFIAICLTIWNPCFASTCSRQELFYHFSHKLGQCRSAPSDKMQLQVQDVIQLQIQGVVYHSRHCCGDEIPQYLGLSDPAPTNAPSKKILNPTPPTYLRPFLLPPSFYSKTQRHEHGDVCNFNCHLVLTSMLKLIFPHQVHLWERWLCSVLDLDGLGQWSLAHALNCRRNILIVGVFNLWKPMECLHKFTNCNNPNQQNP